MDLGPRGARAPFILVSVAVLAAACHSGGSSSGSTPGVAPLTTVTPTLGLNYDAALLDSSSLADLQMSSQSGLANRAYVLEDRGFVRVLDLSAAQPVSLLDLQLDPGGALPQGAAGSSLTISPGPRALVATSGFGFEGVYIFDPATAQTTADVTRIDLNASAVTLPPGALNSTGATVASPMSTTFTASALVAGSKLFIATTNLDQNFDLNPGTVLAFDFDAATNAATNESVIFTSGFDPTRLTAWTSPRGVTAVLCVNAGTASTGSGSSTIDVIDPTRAALVLTIPLGPVSAAGAVAITPDSTRGFVGSQMLGEAYELDLTNLDQQLANTTPQSAPGLLTATIALPGTSSLHFISGIAVSSSGRYLYTLDFNESLLAVFDLIEGPGKAGLVGTVTGFQRSGNPLNFVGNASLLAVRPGTPGVSFSGPSVLVGTINLAPADRTVSQSVTVAIDGVTFNDN
jgi:hypothetical protein